MYRAIIPNGQLEAADYDRTKHGVELYDETGALLAFVPYENLEALLTERAYGTDEPGVL